MERNKFCALTCLTVVLLIHEVKADVCEPTWHLHEHTCFNYYEESIDYAATEEYCSSLGARLISDLTPKLKDFLLSKIPDGGNTSYWCRTQSGEMDHRLFPATTVSSHPTITSSSTVSSTRKEKESCYYIKQKAFHKGDCNVPRGFICEKDSMLHLASCPQGAQKFRGSCFWRTLDLSAKTKAAESCSKEGGQLANLGTKMKRAYAISTVNIRKIRLWVGARKHEGKVQWDDGQILDPKQEKPYIPVKDEGGECVILGINNASEAQASWIFRECSATAYGLCEKQAELITIPMNTTTPLPETTPAPICPGSAAYDREVNGICHWETSYETPRFDWDNARKYCQSYGGDLASYKDEAEEELCIGHVRRHYGGLWIGLRREPGTNIFRWSDGSTLTYTNWAPGQPKLKGNLKLCVAHTQHNATWEVTYCGIHRFFVCKIPKATIPAVPVKPTVAPIPECTRSKTSPGLSWKYHKGYCYAMYLYRDFTWDTGRTFCQDNGAYLASLHSLDELSFLLAMSPGFSSRDNVWLGLRAKGLHSSYHWDDGTPIDFVHWDEDDSYDYSSNVDTCVSFEMSTGTFKKNHCNLLASVFCKVKNDTHHTFPTASPAPSLKGNCPDRWYVFGNKCFRLFELKEKSTWSEANTKCAQIGSELATIHSQDEQDFLALLVLIVQSDTWIGMYSTIGGRLFHWTDKSNIVYTNWDLNEPSNANEKEECVHLVFNENEHRLGKWNDHQCSMRFPFICQIPKDPMLMEPGRDQFRCSKPDGPEGWINLRSSCYQIFNESGNHLTWLNAQSFCLDLNANLASVKNVGVSKILRRHLTGSTEIFWIGMRESGLSRFRWVGTFTDVGYTNWLKDEPRMISDASKCVAMNANGEWMVRSCDESHPFLCEHTKESPTMEPSHQDMMCPNNTEKWKDYGGRFCYIIETNADISWHGASHNCFRQGGYLASFHSLDETEVILHQIKGSPMPVHIGLSQKEDESFGWTDGSAVDYVNWAPGEPNDKEEMCVEMHTDIGTWNDVDCEAKRGYVCSVKKVPRSVSSGDPSADKRKDFQTRISAGGIVGIVICIIVVFVIASVTFYYLCPATRMRVRRQSEPSPL